MQCNRQFFKHRNLHTRRRQSLTTCTNSPSDVRWGKGGWHVRDFLQLISEFSFAETNLQCLMLLLKDECDYAAKYSRTQLFWPKKCVTH